MDDAVKPLVLLIEDNADERTIYSTVLAHDGFSVIESMNAERAVDLVWRHKPDVVVTDLALPSVGGLALTEILRASRMTAHIPIVAISCHHELLQKAGEYGCSAVLPKPFEPRALVQNASQAAAVSP